jgi:hypothetical protein
MMTIAKRRNKYYVDNQEMHDDGSINSEWIPVEKLNNRQRRQILKEIEYNYKTAVYNQDLADAQNLLRWMQKNNAPKEDIEKLKKQIKIEKLSYK